MVAAGVLVVAAPSPGSILHHPGVVDWSWGRCGCQKDPYQTKFQFCWVPCIGGIKLQLLCGVRKELAIGSLPFPGNYSQFVSPGWDRPLPGLPSCKPCLDVRQNSSRDTHFPSYGRCPPNQTKIHRFSNPCPKFHGFRRTHGTHANAATQEGRKIYMCLLFFKFYNKS